MSNQKNLLFQYLLQLGDNSLILGQGLSEWCGHGPVLEQDIAMTNIALDQLGQAKNWLEYAGKVEGAGRSDDDLAFLRNVWEYKNVLLVEQPNNDWGHTIMRNLLFDAFNYFLNTELSKSKDAQIAAIANKSLKEITYHLRYSSEWTIRLGDGTAESHSKMQTALDNLWMFQGEFFDKTEADEKMIENGIGADLDKIQPLYEQKVKAVLKEATLEIPEGNWSQSGGKEGRHSEHIGHILSELQYMQRAYPGMEW